MAVSTAPVSAISAVQQAIAAALSRVEVLIDQVNAAIGTPASFGGVEVGMDPNASANALLASVANTFQLWTLLQLQAVLGRLLKNLSAVSASANTVSTAGSNLFLIAQQEYGDATDWATIAAANGLTDPFIQGSETLIIPPQPGDTGGVLQP